MSKREERDRIRVYLEIGTKRVFACAVDWPGWSRSGKGEEAAIATLMDYAERYREVAENAGIDFPITSESPVEIVERVRGGGGTDFGAPFGVPDLDRRALPAEEAERRARLVRAAWTVFDRVAAQVPAGLRKGPRGGGRDRDKVREHVIGADTGYARHFGLKQRQPDIDDQPAIQANREAVLTALSSPSAEVSPDRRGWTTRFAARYIAWHALDHAWEMEDRAQPAG